MSQQISGSYYYENIERKQKVIGDFEHQFVGEKKKGKSQNGGYKETRHSKFSEKETLIPLDTHTCVCVSRGKKYPFFRKIRRALFSCNLF